MAAKAQVRHGHRVLGLLVAAVTVLAVAPGCATAGSGSDAERSSREVLTRVQLDPVDHMTAYDAIRRYRPTWLRSHRGQDSFVSEGRRGLRIYVDGTFFGGAETLPRLDVRHIQEIRFLDKRKATMRFGTDHGEGAILITTRS
jgi:hypothetical protein